MNSEITLTKQQSSQRYIIVSDTCSAFCFVDITDMPHLKNLPMKASAQEACRMKQCPNLIILMRLP